MSVSVRFIVNGWKQMCNSEISAGNFQTETWMIEYFSLTLSWARLVCKSRVSGVVSWVISSLISENIFFRLSLETWNRCTHQLKDYHMHAWQNMMIYYSFSAHWLAVLLRLSRNYLILPPYGSVPFQWVDRQCLALSVCTKYLDYLLLSCHGKAKGYFGFSCFWVCVRTDYKLCQTLVTQLLHTFRSV